ncbi:MAG TPA: two-component regulator propeller domain-containing protein [Roseateles sp.]
MPNRAPLLITLARLVCLLILTLGAMAGAAAQGWTERATIVFRHAGLPAGFFPLAMLQDRHGQLWIAAQSGLFRWDGHQLQRFSLDSARRASLRSTYVNAVHEDDKGRLWIGTEGGLARIDPATSSFMEFDVGPQGLGDARIAAIIGDGQNGLWVGTAKGLNRVDMSTGQVQRTPEQGVPAGLPPRQVKSLLLDRRGNLWAGMSEGLFLRPAGAKTFQPVPLAGTERGEDVRMLKEDAAGRVWIGTRATGIFVRDPGSGLIHALQDSDQPGRALQMDLRAIADAGNGEMWLGTWGQGIVRVDTESWTTRRVRHEPDIQAGLAADFVSTIFRDRSGLVWVGGPGMMEMTAPGERAISTWFGNEGKFTGGGAGAQLSALLARPDGSVWVGNASGGLNIISSDRGGVRRIPAQDGPPRQTLPRAGVLALAGAPDGRVFIGTVKGLYVADAAGRGVTRLELPGRAPTAMVRALCASNDRMWAGGTDGLSSLDLASGTMSGGVEALRSVAITTLACSQGNALWVGTATGLLRYRPDSGTVERPWPEERPDGTGLPDSSVSGITTDARGRLWVSFYGAGVCIVTPHEKNPAAAVRCLGSGQGLLNLHANAVALDAQGHAWVSTDDGLARIDGESLQPTPLQQADGVGLQAYWTMSVATTREGDILFGGNGLTIVHPAHYQPWRYAAPVALTGLDGRMTTATAIHLGESTRSVQMNFALLDYSAPDRVRYAYRLTDLEEAWTETPAEARVARYTNLHPGHYVFEVKSRNRVGDWTTSRFPVDVEPAWFETVPARAGAALLLMLLLWSVVRLRLRMLAHRTAQLGEQVAQRTLELQQRTEQLEASRQALRRLGAHTEHTLEEERKRVARELHDELGQQLVAMRMEVSVLKARAAAGQPPTPEQWQLVRERVDRFTASMRSLVADLRPPALDGGLVPALEWLAAEYRRMSDADCEVVVDGDVRALAPTVKTALFRVAQESLNNVLRHARAHHVMLRLNRDSDSWQLGIEDDGVGFDTASPPGGFGLLSMEERAELLGGRLTVDSRPGEGCRILLRLPAAAAENPR